MLRQQKISLDLKIVPVGHELNYNAQELETALNEIYGQTVVSWDVEYLPALDYNQWGTNGEACICYNTITTSD
jgi:hypothetical protein